MISVKTTQTGELFAGSRGVALRFKLIPPAGAEFDFDLDDTTAIHIDFQRPDGSTFDADLNIPGDVIDSANRIVRYITQDGDTPISGRYEFSMAIDAGPGERIIAQGTFKVS